MATGAKSFRFGKTLGSDLKNKTAGGARYTGKTPPSGTYRVSVKRLMLKPNQHNDMMLVLLLEINEPKGNDDAVYNGYGFFVQQNITDQGAGYINQVLEALANGDADKEESLKDGFWDEDGVIKAVPDEKMTNAMNIKKIGDVVINSPDVKGYEMICACKFVPAKGKYEAKLDVNAYMPLSASDKVGDDVVDDDETEDVSEDEAAEDPDTDEADEADEDEDEDEEADEDEDPDF